MRESSVVCGDGLGLVMVAVGSVLVFWEGV